jgi:hydrogenase-4 component H
MEDDTKANPPVRRITHRSYACIFCGNCQANCTTGTSIKLSKTWDLATLNKDELVETHEFELQRCEKCDEILGTKKHLVWLYEKLGPLAYTNPSLLISKSGELTKNGTPRGVSHCGPQEVAPQPQPARPPETSDFMRILCPKCKCRLNIQL